VTLVGWSALEGALVLALGTLLVLLARGRRAVQRDRDAFARQGRVISAAVQRLAGIADPTAVLQTATELAAELISPSAPKGRRALYFVVEGEVARVVAQVDEAGAPPQPPVRLADHQALAEVVATLTPIRTVLPAAGLGPTARSSGEATQVTHGAAVPVVAAGRLHGVLAVGGRGRPIEEFDRLVDLGRIVELALTNALATERLAEQATTDPLTGCANRRGIEQAARLQSTRHPFSLVVADLDGLKELNDREGHEAGDRVLQAFADATRSLLRTGDVLARVGGDEFLVLLQETDGDGAAHFCERLLADLARTPSLRASLGLSTCRDPKDFDAAWRAADEAMYRAKKQGGMQYARAAAVPAPREAPMPDPLFRR
jgi:diguanylate cyclase (GGDEF)-like protein